MTREEREDAIKGLEGLSRAFGGYKPNEEMFEMAIAALKAEPCEDAISRQAVLNQIFYSTDNSGDVVLGSTLRHRIENLPPVTPKPMTGKWIRHTRVENVYDIAGVKTWGIKHQCDQCTFTTIAIEDFGYYDYCPHCGAKMEGE